MIDPTLPTHASGHDVHERYHRLVELSPDGILIHDGEQIVMANAAAVRLARGHTAADLVGRPIAAFLRPPYLKGVQQQLINNDRTDHSPVVRDTLQRVDGTSVEVEVTAIPFLDHGRMAAHVVIRDITARLVTNARIRDAEERLRVTHKLEAIGVLAGGVAQEVSSMMVVVLGASDFLLGESVSADDRRREVRVIWKAADRAATLTRQLLEFSQRATHVPRAIELDEFIRGLVPAIGRVVQPRQEFVVELGGPFGLRADGAQIEQVIVHLVLNARDAMSIGGTLTIATTRTVIGEGFTAHAGTPVPAGAYVVVRISDTGVGMSPETITRLFEPFFTTKTTGHGTGLGLAAVYGMIAQNAGYVTVESAPGTGTTFTLYFPLIAAGTTIARRDSGTQIVVAGERAGLTILVVDDDSIARTLTRRTLERAGFHVRLAINGAVALEMISHRLTPDLVVSASRMPGMSGAELAQRLRVQWPLLPVLLMTSGVEPAAAADVDATWTGAVIEAPFAPDDLVRKVLTVFAAIELPLVPPVRAMPVAAEET